MTKNLIRKKKNNKPASRQKVLLRTHDEWRFQEKNESATEKKIFRFFCVFIRRKLLCIPENSFSCWNLKYMNKCCLSRGYFYNLPNEIDLILISLERYSALLVFQTHLFKLRSDRFWERWKCTSLLVKSKWAYKQTSGGMRSED